MNSWGLALKSDRSARLWAIAALAEAASAAALTAILLLPLFHLTMRPMLWFAAAAVFGAIYFLLSLKTVLEIQKYAGNSGTLLALGSLPFLLIYGASLTLLLVQPELAGKLWHFTSPILPFPLIAVGLSFLLVCAVKLTAAAFAHPSGSEARSRALSVNADRLIPLALLALGVLQASVYLVPIGNAFLRHWAIADAMTFGTAYPVTLTEAGPMSAGSPPYVYDLPLFPMMLIAAFTFLGHNSAAGHLPAMLANCLFPLSLYLLIKQATGSRPIAIIFSTMTALFPYLRFWVLNLPDPDPLLLTSMCLAAYFYLRAFAAPKKLWIWLIAGLALGVLSLARPEGLLYAGCLALGLLAAKPAFKNLAAFSVVLGAFVLPTIAMWWINYGFLWPQNYNNTLRLDFPFRNYDILESMGWLSFYHRGLGLDATWGLIILALLAISVIVGTAAMLFKDRRLLAIVIPGIGNTVLIWFANPYIPNTYHFADFFRHACFGTPFLALASAYSFYLLHGYLSRKRLRVAGYICMLVLVAVVVREGDILSNPTATHRPGTEQVLTTYTYLSMESILQHPMPLPRMDYYHDGGVTVARLESMPWPDKALEFYQPLDMTFQMWGTPFGYTSVIAFALALGIALIAESARKSDASEERQHRG